MKKIKILLIVIVVISLLAGCQKKTIDIKTMDGSIIEINTKGMTNNQIELLEKINSGQADIIDLIDTGEFSYDEVVKLDLLTKIQYDNIIDPNLFADAVIPIIEEDVNTVIFLADDRFEITLQEYNTTKAFYGNKYTSIDEKFIISKILIKKLILDDASVYNISVSQEEALEVSLEEKRLLENESDEEYIVAFNNYIEKLGIDQEEYWNDYHVIESQYMILVGKLREYMSEKWSNEGIDISDENYFVNYYEDKASNLKYIKVD